MSGRAVVVAAGAGVALAAAAAVVLAGWVTGVEAMRSMLPGSVAMNPLTAICFAAIGGALVRARAETRASDPLVVALVALVAVAAVTRLAAYAGAPDAGLDGLLFRDALDLYTTPNRMAPNTALAMLACAAALPLVRARGQQAILAGQLLALGAGVAGLVTIAGYAFGLRGLAGVLSFIPMALPTALCFVVAATGTLALRLDEGIVQEAAAPTPGGQLFRRTAPAAVLLPPILAWLALLGVEAGLFTSHIAISIAVIVGTMLLVALLAANARRLDRAEATRARADEMTESLVLDLEGRSAELAAANAELEAFSYSVSHDLRAPLRSIGGFSQILLEDYGETLNQEARSHLDRIVRASTRMSLLIDDLLELSRHSRGVLARSHVDLSAMAADVVGELRAAEPQRTVEVSIQPGLEVWADARMLRVVLVNLIGNAWKYSGRAQHPRIEVGRTRAGELFVRDNGVGFDMKYADRLFTPFQRLHSDEDFAGSGIGLALVRRIVHRHGGATRAESEPGRGATFFFTLNPENEA